MPRAVTNEEDVPEIKLDTKDTVARLTSRGVEIVLREFTVTIFWAEWHLLTDFVRAHPAQANPKKGR